MTDRFLPPDDTARALARHLIGEARHAALGTLDAGTGFPHVTRVALGQDGAGLLLLLSALAPHLANLRADPRCSLLLGGQDGGADPLAQPRLTLTGTVSRADKIALRPAWVALQPQAAAYYDFADFDLLRVTVLTGHLNGGFARAWRLGPADLPGSVPLA